MSTVSLSPDLIKNNLLLNFDASVQKSYSVNLIPYPIDLFAWCQNASTPRCIISRDTSITRQYGSIPLKMSITGDDPYISTYNASQWNLSTAASGEIWTLSAYVKSSVDTTVQLFIFGADSSGNAIEGYAETINCKTYWTRISITYTLWSASITRVQCRLDGTPTSGSGVNIWWDGVQLEKNNTATRFNPYNIGLDKWKDVSKYNATATLFNSPKFVYQNYGIMNFDDTVYEYATIPNIGSLTKFSIETWARTNKSLTGKVTTIVTNEYDLVSNLNFSLGTLNAPTDTDIRFGFYNGAWRFTSGFAMATNTWYHIVGTYDGATIRLFVNGLLYSSTNYTGTAASGGNIRIARRWDDVANNANYFFSGDIALLRIYNRSLPSTEVIKNYNDTKTRFLS